MKTLLYAILATIFIVFPSSLHADNDVVQFGHAIDVGPGEHKGDLVCIGCSIRSASDVRDVVAIGGNATVLGRARDVVAVGGGVNLGPDAKVSRDAVAVGGVVDRSPGAEIGRDNSSIGVPIFNHIAASWVILLLFFAIFGGFFWILLTLFVYAVTGRQRAQVMANTAGQNTGMAFLAGLAACIGAVILTGLSHYLGPVKFVLPIVIALAFILVLVVGYTGLSLWIGERLRGGIESTWTVLLGAVVISLLQCIPFVGPLLFLFFSILAIGVGIVSGLGNNREWLTQTLARPAANAGR